MASHYQNSGKVVPLHRGSVPCDVEPPADYSPLDTFDSELKRSLVDSDMLFGAALGFLAGMLCTAGLAQLVAWAVL